MRMELTDEDSAVFVSRVRASWVCRSSTSWESSRTCEPRSRDAASYACARTRPNTFTTASSALRTSANTASSSSSIRRDSPCRSL